MQNKISEAYLNELLGKVTFEEAKAKLIQYAVYNLFTHEFDKLLNEGPAVERAVDNDTSNWNDELFTEDKHQVVEALIILPSWFNIKKDFIEYYNRLLLSPWHHEHESLIELIKNTRSVSSTPYIEKAIQNNYKYLHFNDTNYASFIRKCMWALADINSPESIDLLHKYINDDNEVIRKYADEQIRWLNGEKGMRYMS